MANPSYRIGVDGGGTKTELLLVDSAGNIVARHVGPGCNPSHLGADQARTVLLAALEALLTESKIENPKSKISATRLYVAGSAVTWREIVAQLHDYGTVTHGPDSLPVLELATGGAPGLVLHAGTGSFVAARAPDGSVHFAGGLGWRFGDPGSGYELGRRAIAAALMELSGWSPATGLGAALQTHLGLADATAIKGALYADPEVNARTAAFAPRVIELAQNGCRPAQIALASSVGELVAQGRLVTEKLFPGGQEITCGVSGAVLNNPAAHAALQAFVASNAWPVKLHFITDPPSAGVRRLLLRD
ncbi:MAG: ATPase [Candidatus Didemnitutus sp.]|nr:ATPase [Candidatus Didemnitutus sp.]